MTTHTDTQKSWHYDNRGPPGSGRKKRKGWAELCHTQYYNQVELDLNKWNQFRLNNWISFDGKRPLTKDNLWQKTTFDGRRPLTEDNLWWKTTLDGGHPLTVDDLYRKTTFDRRRPLIEDDLWRKTTLDRRWPLTEDDLSRKTTFDGRQPLTEDDLWRKTTFDGRQPLIYYLKKIYNSSPWQPKHYWPQIGNLISCLNRK